MSTGMAALARSRKARLVSLGLIVAAAVALLDLPFAAATQPPAEWDGLVRVDKRKEVDHLYLLPNVTFAGYKRVRLDPTQVAFDKNWNPNARQHNPAGKLSSEDLEDIKSTLASEFHKIFGDELNKGGYALVDEDGDDVLRVTPAIINLYITAPDRPTAGRSRTYVASAGHMTLVLELRDSVTSQLLARAIDTQRATETGRFQITNSVTNLGEARLALGRWAGLLRKALDEAEGHSAKE
jgi:hypothetical protein